MAKQFTQDKNSVLVDWEKVKILKANTTLPDTTIGKLIDAGRSWMSDGMHGKVRYAPPERIEKLALILGVQPEELILKPALHNDKPPEDGGKQNEVLVRLAAIERKLDELHEVLAAFSKPEKREFSVKDYDNFAKKPAAEKAEMILEELMKEKQGKALRSEYIKRLTIHDVGSSYAKTAVEKLGYQIATSGLGNNTTTWILSR